ncbi:hypothetical protein N7481_007529 [Penicillium waksmanii]|uniref:uncharacterized protein n=1 Tax=Penicillium waksmanii TaxID=69791 RepID=UPI002547AAC0|nr:uncharacterized protein N7481_007529 [Penicillium waksmanii]KAJ5980231.1 hypothetical protein N7481_007529 [Penicillium waksmanii]
MSMPTDLSLGEILHLSLGEGEKCFGLTKFYGGTKPCNHPLGKQRLADADKILVQTPGRLERGGQTIDQHLINLSNLLVHSSRHGVNGDSRRESLQSEWMGFVQDFRRAQIHSETPIEILHQSEDDELNNASEDEDLQEVPAPVLAIESDTATSIVATRSTHTDLDTTPDSTPIPDLPTQAEESQVQISHERTSNVLRPVPESLGDRTSLTPACLSGAHTSFRSADDVSLESVWLLLLQFCFGVRALMFVKFHAFCSIDGYVRFGRGSFADLQFLARKISFSNEPTWAQVFMISFCYVLFGLLQILLRSNVLVVLVL